MERAEDKTVLVVDDEPNVRDYLANLLKDAGFNVITAGDGHEALEIIRSQKPDFISLDLVMPRKSGHKLLFELRKDKSLAQIPVLIVTAHAQDEMGQSDLEDIIRTMPAPVSTIRKDPIEPGQTLYLEKPVNRLDYVRCVQRMLGLEEAKEEAEATSLKDKLEQQIRNADPDALRRALEALGKKESSRG
jgi:CheY-like chemotaxis protein